MLGQLLFKGHWSLRSTICRIICITWGSEIQRARAPLGAVKRCLCLAQLIILPSVLGSDSSAGSGSWVNVLTPSPPSSHHEDRPKVVIFSSPFCFTQMLDSALMQKKNHSPAPRQKHWAGWCFQLMQRWDMWANFKHKVWFRLPSLRTNRERGSSNDNLEDWNACFNSPSMSHLCT